MFRLVGLKIIFIVLVACAASCTTIKPYEKEYLLSPLMDDGGVARLTPSYAMSRLSDNEKLAAGSSGSSASSSCPTCGG